MAYIPCVDVISLLNRFSVVAVIKVRIGENKRGIGNEGGGVQSDFKVWESGECLIGSPSGRKQLWLFKNNYFFNLCALAF